MNIYLLWLIIVSSVMGFFFVFMPILFSYLLSWGLYVHVMTRSKKAKRERKVSDDQDYEQMMMYEEGMAWAKKHEKEKKDLQIVSRDGLHLYGQYFALSESKKAVIIVPGRTESLHYSYYYGPLYEKLGINVLVVDKRCHGLSDGVKDDLGQRHSDDILLWAKLLHEKLGITDITLHGICIGASITCFAYAKKDCPSYIRRLVTDGMYPTFRTLFKRHIHSLYHPAILTLDLTMLHALVSTHINCFTNGPVRQVRHIQDKPILIMSSKKDVFVHPKDTRKIVRNCSSKNRETYLFPEGRHSHVRFKNPKLYDQVVSDFIEKYN